jgi:hypothetical protein
LIFCAATLLRLKPLAALKCILTLLVKRFEKMKIFTLIWMVTLIFLSGCATTQPCEPVIVNKVVSVSCVTEVPQKPELTSIKLPDNVTLAEQIQAISVDAFLFLQYSNEQAAVIVGCQ